MLGALLTFSMLIGNAGQATARAASNSALERSQPTPTPATATVPSPNEDLQAESELLRLANESRQHAGLAPLRVDGGLASAAREHARRMIAAPELSHQYAGELPLLKRIAELSSLRLDQAGENIAFNSDAQSAHDALMHSPPHRENLLNPSFNAAGVAAIWSNGRLYVVEDFARSVPARSPQESARLIARSIAEARNEAGLSPLREVSDASLDQAVCSLARQGHLSTHRLNAAYSSRTIVTYTQSRPEILPQNAVRFLKTSTISEYAVGTCYARDHEYPSGIYWVAILFY